MSRVFAGQPSADPAAGRSPLAAGLVAVLRAYQRWISPALPARCRFYPTCSTYAVQAIVTRGTVVGLLLTGWRLLRCQPFHPGGVDPVPPRRSVSTRGTRRTSTVADVPGAAHTC